MAQTKEGVKKARLTNIKKHGSEEAYKAFMHKIASEGGKNGRTGGFYNSPDRAREAGRKGGYKSRRSYCSDEVFIMVYNKHNGNVAKVMYELGYKSPTSVYNRANKLRSTSRKKFNIAKIFRFEV